MNTLDLRRLANAWKLGRIWRHCEYDSLGLNEANDIA